MKTYNPKDWYSFFRLDHADTLKKLYLLIIFVAAYSWLVVFLEIEYFRLLRGS